MAARVGLRYGLQLLPNNPEDASLHATAVRAQRTHSVDSGIARSRVRGILP